MDFNEKKIIYANQSRAYFWSNTKNGENFNFYDYSFPGVEQHLVVEGPVEKSFSKLINSNVKGMSIVTTGDVGLNDVFELIPHVEVLFLQCNSISQAEFLSRFERLDFFSLSSIQNQVVRFFLPKQMKGFVSTWKDKFEFAEFSSSLQYLSLEKAKKLDFALVFGQSKKLVKLELMECKLGDRFLDAIVTLGNLQYLSLVNCLRFEQAEIEGVNTSVRYIHLKKTKVSDLMWVERFPNLDILILEDCGEIDTIRPLEQARILRGLWLSGDSRIIDGNLNWLDSLPNLENLFIRDYPNYTHRSISPWNWKNFGSGQRSDLYYRK